MHPSQTENQMVKIYSAHAAGLVGKLKLIQQQHESPPLPVHHVCSATAAS